MKKSIVCFANSRKNNGRCFAGKDIDSGEWIRPISSTSQGELSLSDVCIRKNNECSCEFCNPIEPKLLDIVEVELIYKNQRDHQTENYIIANKKWVHIGNLTKDNVDNYLDKDNVDLWINGYKSYYGLNDRFPGNVNLNINYSLRLIEVNSFYIRVRIEGKEFDNPRKKVRGKFNFNDREYVIPITDPTIELGYLQYDEGLYQYGRNKRVILCLSIGNVYNDGYIYKFISGILTI